MSDQQVYLAIIQKEWDQCRADIGRYDALTFEIRRWTISVALAISGAAFVAKKPELVVLAYVSTAIFWMLDAHNKTYQKVYIRRVHDIELGLRAFQLSGDRISCPRISDDFTAEFSRPMGRRLLQTFRQGMRLGVWLPYFGVSALLTAILFADLGRSQGAP